MTSEDVCPPCITLFIFTIDPPTSIVILEEQNNHVHFEPDVLLTLTCQANDAKPPANIVWKIDNKNFSSNYPGNITLWYVIVLKGL